MMRLRPIHVARDVSVIVVLMALHLAWAGCKNEPGDCLSEQDCPNDNEFCEPDDPSLLTGECEETCGAQTVEGDGSDGAGCRFDSDCDSNDCANDVGRAPCTCVGAGTGGTGGTGGAGGAGGTGGGPDPCTAPLPTPATGSSLNVDVYAVFDMRPAGISFADDGTLYVGTDVPEPMSPVFWVQPGGTSIGTSTTLFADPDAVVVDVNGLFATAGNVLIGGSPDGGQTGQLMEMTAAGQPGEGQQVGEPFRDMCLRNINHLIFDRDDRLLVTNFNNVSANVCAIEGGMVTDLIPDVEGDGPAGITVQDPVTGDLFVTTENNVYRYNSGGTMPVLYTDNGTALAYGPAGSAFEGLLIRRSGMLLRVDLGTSVETPLLTGSIGPLAFDSNGAGANLYFADRPNRRVIRVSEQRLDPTPACP